jgi:hypothetical protein
MDARVDINGLGGYKEKGVNNDKGHQPPGEGLLGWYFAYGGGSDPPLQSMQIFAEALEIEVHSP